MFRNIIKRTNKGIKPINTLCMSLAGKIGVGSIAGIAFGIYIGGIGTIFWIWVSSFLLISVCFAETVLGVVYKEKDSKDIYIGGPSFYIKKGLCNKKLAVLYSVIIVISYMFGFITIQANTVVKSLDYAFDFSPFIICILIMIFTFFSISRGVKLIAKISSFLVPIMLIIYITIASYILFINLNQIPYLFCQIVNDAFNFKSGIIGFLTSIFIGFQRGIFSTEASLGTGVISSSTIVSNNSCSQGFVQMIGVYITSLFVCTSSAFIILTSNYEAFTMLDINGIEFSIFAFNYHLGSFGVSVLVFTIILFSLSTILTGYYNIESSLKFLIPNLRNLKLLKGLILLMIILGCYLPSKSVWDLVDILVIVLALINIYAIYNLKDIVFYEFKYYKSRNIK